MLTAEIIFKYVWQHFCSVFPEAKGLAVAYGNSQNGKVIIPTTGLPFFEKTLPFPEEICWQNWQEQTIPFLFQNSIKEVITNQENKIEIQADIIAGAFYFLSGWQEYYVPERDKFNRFPYKASLQYKENFITIPVVNYYFNILKTALEKAYDISLINRLWGKHTFSTFLSHDVDRLESGWKVGGIKQLKKGNLPAMLQLLTQKLRGRDNWDNLKTVVKTIKKYEAVSTFFWLAQEGKFNNHPNADYKIIEPKYQQLIKELEAEGFENGVHGSFGTSENAAQLKTETAKLNVEVSGNRFHYLCYNPQKTSQVLTEAGIKYDSTLGFAEHFGFRNSYCFPFRPFDFSNSKPYPFLEIPLNLMDTTLWQKNYLQIPAKEVVQTIKPMLQEIEKFGGVFGLLWHNENFSEFNTENGLAAFESIMQQLKKMNSAFHTGRQICKIFDPKI